MEHIYLELDEKEIHPIAESLMNSDLRHEGYSINQDPHISLIPPFETRERIQLPEFEPPQRIRVSGLEFWPDIEDPMMVLLDVSDDMVLQLWRDEILTQIGRDSVQEELRSPRIPLLKSGEYDEKYDFTIDPDIRNNLLEESESVPVPSVVHATDIIQKII